MRTLILFLLFSASVFAQKGMVLIEAEQTLNIMDFHSMKVPDALTAKVVQRYVFFMENNPVNYERGIRKVKKIVMVKKDRYFVCEFSRGTLYLNDRLNRFPATKEVVIIQTLAALNGMKLKRGDSADVRSRNFAITDENEERFRRQLTRHSPYKYVVQEMESK